MSILHQEVGGGALSGAVVGLEGRHLGEGARLHVFERKAQDVGLRAAGLAGAGGSGAAGPARLARLEPVADASATQVLLGLGRERVGSRSSNVVPAPNVV